MDMALHELPLAIFTTLAQGAGAFVTLAIVFLSKKFSAEEYKRIDAITIGAFAVLLDRTDRVVRSSGEPLQRF